MSIYSMNVQWSEADQLFLVTIPEFADRIVMPCTHGETREQAIHNGEEVIEALFITLNEGKAFGLLVVKVKLVKVNEKLVNVKVKVTVKVKVIVKRKEK